MSSTAEHLLEILNRVRAGKHLGRGDMPAPTLQSDISLLLVLRLIERGVIFPFRLTAVGAQALSVAGGRQPGGRDRSGFGE